MDTEKYEALLTAIETGSISAAALKMQFTPSGISRSIASLEETVGFPLLIRGKNGVKPTNECGEILPRIRQLMSVQKQIQQEAAAICGLEHGTIVIGSAYTSYNSLIAERIVAFRKLHPGIDIKMTEGTSTELINKLCDHELDMCIVSYRDNIPVFDLMKRDNMMAWVSAGHPAVKKGVYRLKDFEKDPYIDIYPGRETDNSLFLRKHNIQTNKCADTSDIYAAFSMVEAGMGVAMINEINARRFQGGVVALALDKKLEVQIGIASMPPEETSPAVKAFRKAFEL